MFSHFHLHLPLDSYTEISLKNKIEANDALLEKLLLLNKQEPMKEKKEMSRELVLSQTSFEYSDRVEQSKSIMLFLSSEQGYHSSQATRLTTVTDDGKKLTTGST